LGGLSSGLWNSREEIKQYWLTKVSESKLDVEVLEIIAEEKKGLIARGTELCSFEIPTIPRNSLYQYLTYHPRIRGFGSDPNSPVSDLEDPSFPSPRRCEIVLCSAFQHYPHNGNIPYEHKAIGREEIGTSGHHHLPFLQIPKHFLGIA
jgi:hypothetical protein